jgi:hypothetical protein
MLQHSPTRPYPRLKNRAKKIVVPSMLHLCCNTVEILRLRRQLIDAVVQTKVLEEVYEKQCKTASKDGRVYFKEKFNFDDPSVSKQEKLMMVNFVDDGATSGVDIDLAVNEFDPTMRANLNFGDPESFKILMCPLGLEELRICLHYQLLTLQQLIIATRINQSLIDEPKRYLKEIEFAFDGIILANPTLDLFRKLTP